MKVTVFAMTTATVAILAAGCSAYGWADTVTEDQDGSSPTVDIAPLQAPAHLGLDVSMLRTLLGDELELHGVAVAPDGGDATLRCTVYNRRSRSFGRDLVAELDLGCEMDSAGGERPSKTFRTRGFAADTVAGQPSFPHAVIAGNRRADTAAAGDAIARIALDIAAAVRSSSDSRYFDE